MIAQDSEKKEMCISFIYPRSCEFELKDLGSSIFVIKLKSPKDTFYNKVAVISLNEDKTHLLLDVVEYDTNLKVLNTCEGYEKMMSEEGKEIKVSDGDIVVLRSNDIYRHKVSCQRTMASSYVDVIKSFKIELISFEV